DDGPPRGELVLQRVQLAGVAGAQDDGAVLALAQAVDLAVVQAGDFAAFLGRLVDLEELGLHAGADQDAAVVAQEAKQHRLFAEQLAHRAVGGDAVQRILAGGGRGRGRGGVFLGRLVVLVGRAVAAGGRLRLGFILVLGVALLLRFLAGRRGAVLAAQGAGGAGRHGSAGVGAARTPFHRGAGAG